MLFRSEYETGIKGVLVIHKKQVDIIGLKLEDKVDDGKSEVNIDKTNLELKGIADNDKELIGLEVIDKTNYDTMELGEKFVTLQKDADYKLDLKENVDVSNQDLINCYELPETITLNGKLIAKETSASGGNANDNIDKPNSYVTEETKESTDIFEKWNASKKRIKDKVSEKLSYTGYKMEANLVVLLFVIVIFNVISGRMWIGRSHKRKEPRIFEEINKK